MNQLWDDPRVWPHVHGYTTSPAKTCRIIKPSIVEVLKREKLTERERPKGWHVAAVLDWLQ